MENKKSDHYPDAKHIVSRELKSANPCKQGSETPNAGDQKSRVADRPRTRRDIDNICADWIWRVGCAQDARCAIVKGALTSTRLSESEENKALSRANAGDDEAQRLLSLSFSIPALRPILLRDEFEDDTDDVFQNAMVKIIEVISSKTIKNAREARATITPLIHQELTRTTKERARRPVEEPLDDEMPADADATSPDERLNRAQEMSCVTNALTSLALRDRITILARLEGIPYRKIGAHLKISGERVRQIEKHAIKNIQEIITRGPGQQ